MYPWCRLCYPGRLILKMAFLLSVVTDSAPLCPVRVPSFSLGDSAQLKFPVVYLNTMKEGLCS